jgi:hypothetical protein
VPPAERILTFNQVPEAYTSREVMVVYQSAGGAIGNHSGRHHSRIQAGARSIFNSAQEVTAWLVQTANHHLDQ